MKTVKIDTCWHCKYEKRGWRACAHPELESVRELEDGGVSIPEWCPLPDARQSEPEAGK